MGPRHPEVVVVAEKSTLRREVEALAEAFGVFWLILGGQPSAFGIELFADMLRPALQGRPVRVVAYVDFDPSGWSIADAFCRQLARFGPETEDLRFLVRPDRFTPQELARLAYPLTPRGRGGKTALRRWVERSGGVGGRALALYADWFRPVLRVIRAFQEETGLVPR